MSSPTSFDLLDSKIQRWIRNQGWKELRPVQDQSIRAILSSQSDILITATTAAGKTEAAFFPLLSLAAAREEPGLSILYISPLKALINDQHRRLETICDDLEMPAVRWHGDAPQGAKNRLMKRPKGVALITPESIEALFLRRPNVAHQLFGKLDAILIDELHAFLQGARGLHLASLLQRIDAISERRARRIGLSATIGSPELAAKWLCAPNPESVQIIHAQGGKPELKLQIRSYFDPPEKDAGDRLDKADPPDALSDICDHLFERLRGNNNLVFAGSRKNVEATSYRLSKRAEIDGLPNEFFPHHGNLSKDLREDLEVRLKEGKLPTTAVATTTLELGIDIGSVTSVAQIGAPRSLASLRQRLGRSGRRDGTAAILRIYLRESHLSAVSGPMDRLRHSTVRACAAINLLLENFVEPPTSGDALGTVVLHQILSLIVERGGMTPQRLYGLICSPGPFSSVSSSEFAILLRYAAEPDVALIEQAPDGTVMLGRMGEIITQKRDFYAIFDTADEWRLVAGGRQLGTIPLSNAIGTGTVIGFAGKRWRVVSVDDRAKVVDVISHPSGVIPNFDRTGYEELHDKLVAQMRVLYESDDVPIYLDDNAQIALQEGRQAYRKLALRKSCYVPEGRDTHLFTWRGTAVNSVLAILGMTAGVDCEVHDLGVTFCDCNGTDVQALLNKLEICPPLSEIAPLIENLRTAKYDEYLPDELLQSLWAKRNEHIRPSIDKILFEVKNSSS